MSDEKPPDEIPTEEQEKLELQQYIDELQTKINQRSQVRHENTTVTYPQEDFFTKLDSSLKKNTAFVKKVKQFTASQLDTLLNDLSGLNLTKYISEISVGLSETKLKLSDIPAALTLCTKIHQIYPDFGKSFLENWQKVLMIKPGEKVSNPSKMRVDLRFFAELLSCGIFPTKAALGTLGTTLIALMQHDTTDHANISIIISFCKNCGEEFGGLHPMRMIQLAEKYQKTLPKSSLLPEDKQQVFKQRLKDYYTSLAKHLKSEHKELQIAERNKRKQIQSKGEISQEKREQLESLQASYDKLLSSTQILSDLLNEPMPELPIDTEQAEEGGIVNISDDFTNVQLDPWGDEDTKMFYTDLPDLRGILPNYSAPKEVSPVDTEDQVVTEEALDADDEPELKVDPNLEVSDPTSITPDNQDEPTPEHNKIQIQSKQQFEVFLQNLVNCVNKEMADSAAIEFLLNYNIKPYRKKLVRTLFGVHRTRLDLLPMYGRIMAVINLVAPDAAIDLCQLLKNDFKYQVAKRDQINIESKIKVVRFIAELVKFGLYQKLEALMCLKILLYNFQHHQIEMTCAFLEVCGTYLYNSKESRLRTLAALEKMMRLKSVHNLDPRHVAQVENCYYLIKPPENVGAPVKERPPMHSYVRHLIFEELNKNNVEMMIKLLRRLNYNDPELQQYLIKCLSKAYNLRYHLIKYLADLLSGYSSYQEQIVTHVIDNVFEDIRAGLEIHSPKLAQRRIAMVTYLGEMFNYRLITAQHVVNTLYLIISFGITMNYETPSDVDPPGSLFRLKLACTLLNTCGLYFTKTSHRKMLDYFIVFLQRYYWFKKEDPIFTQNNGDLFPILIEYSYKECLSTLRPKLKLFKSYDEANKAVEKLRRQLYPDLDKNSEESNLDTIKEVGESERDDEGTEEVTSEAAGEDSEDETKPREMMEEDDFAENQVELSDMETNEEIDRQFSRKDETKNQDDLEFEQMFEKLTQESYQERVRDAVKSAAKDVPIPTTGKPTTKKTYEQLQTPEPETPKDSVPFTLMLRGPKAGKQQLKTFQAPIESQLAQNLIKQKEQIREENERVKRLTLNITERIEEEDYQESLLQNQKPIQMPQFRNQKYQKFKHQKGAPDADAIFN
uniref:CSON014173 protein n=1 Tax=Culicoides sonorensis TaxID=179676 RepID=A0A336MDV6_CULSO